MESLKIPESRTPFYLVSDPSGKKNAREVWIGK